MEAFEKEPFASVLPPELFQTCAFQDTGDEWYFECIEHTEKYHAAEDFLDIECELPEKGDAQSKSILGGKHRKP